VEIKPRKFLEEMEIFSDEIHKSESAWICVDQGDRGIWELLKHNESFTFGRSILIWGPCPIEFIKEEGFPSPLLRLDSPTTFNPS
jgi:hypothetical protein